jgi:hypothetical protein
MRYNLGEKYNTFYKYILLHKISGSDIKYHSHLGSSYGNRVDISKRKPIITMTGRTLEASFMKIRKLIQKLRGGGGMDMIGKPAVPYKIKIET